MVQNIINLLKLRETCFNKNSFKLRCKQCNSYLNYDIQFKNYVKNITIDGDDKFVVESTKKIIPNFLINNDIYVNNKTDIFNGFKIVGEFLDKSILKPNNINYPLSRTELGNLIKST